MNASGRFLLQFSERSPGQTPWVHLRRMAVSYAKKERFGQHPLKI
nr:MAG TPA: hypothetical protein [Caudoviricetes sp.]